MSAFDEMVEILKENGGPAYPCTAALKTGGNAVFSGLTIRDWFAGQALCGILASFPPDANFATVGSKMALALDGYALADAMLAARKERP